MAIAVLWTEGKTDTQYLRRASRELAFPHALDFPVSNDMGDDALLKQCIALSRVPQPQPTIFIFDRDNPNIIPKVTNDVGGFRSWGNNVYSFAIPIPHHRPDAASACIELYFKDSDLKLSQTGRRLFLSSEFNNVSGRHATDSTLSVENKGRLSHQTYFAKA